MNNGNYEGIGWKGIAGIIAGALTVIVALITWVWLIDAVAPNAGHEAVLTHKPILFGEEGVDPVPVKAGRKYVWWTTIATDVNMQPLQFSEHFEDLMSSDGVPLDFDSILRLRVTDSVVLIRDFGPEWYEKNVKAEYRNRVRQAVRKHGMNETAIDTKAIDAIDKEVSEAMRICLKEAKLPLLMMDVTVGKANPPDSIKDQRVKTAAEQQRALSEHQRKLAEDVRKKAEESRAASDNAYREAMKLSPDQFLQLENIKMMHDVCAGGRCTFLVGPSSVSPIVDIRKDVPLPAQAAPAAAPAPNAPKGKK